MRERGNYVGYGSPSFSFLPYSIVPILAEVNIKPVQINLNNARVECHKCLGVNENVGLMCVKVYQPLGEVLNTPSDEAVFLS